MLRSTQNHVDYAIQVFGMKRTHVRVLKSNVTHTTKKVTHVRPVYSYIPFVDHLSATSVRNLSVPTNIRPSRISIWYHAAMVDGVRRMRCFSRQPLLSPASWWVISLARPAHNAQRRRLVMHALIDSSLSVIGTIERRRSALTELALRVSHLVQRVPGASWHRRLRRRLPERRPGRCGGR